MNVDTEKCLTCAAIAVCLVLMITSILEMRQRMTSLPSACGAASSPEDAASAKLGTHSGHAHFDVGHTYANDESFSDVKEPWMNTADANEYKGSPQDEQALRAQYTWSASTEDEKKFETIRVDKDKLKKAANYRPTTEAEPPRGTRTTGSVNPLLTILKTSQGAKEHVAIDCSKPIDFNGTDAHAMAAIAAKCAQKNKVL